MDRCVTGLQLSCPPLMRRRRAPLARFNVYEMDEMHGRTANVYDTNTLERIRVLIEVSEQTRFFFYRLGDRESGFFTYETYQRTPIAF